MNLERYGPLANEIIHRLAITPREQVTVNQRVIERSFDQHLHLLGLEALPVQWFDHAETAFDEMAQLFSTAHSKVVSADDQKVLDGYYTSFLRGNPDDRGVTAIEERIQQSRLTVLSKDYKSAIAGLNHEMATLHKKTLYRMCWPNFRALTWGSSSESLRWRTSFVGSWSFAEETAIAHVTHQRSRFRKGFEAAHDEVQPAAWMALDAAYWAAIQTLAAETSPLVENYIAAHKLFLEAYEMGLWCFWICPTEIMAVLRPSLHLQEDRLHCEHGPAVFWPNGPRYYFWQGAPVPAVVVESPQNLTVADIDTVTNLEVRRLFIERFGQERYLMEGDAVIVDATDWGTLYRQPKRDTEDMVIVKVTNATAEPDGTFKDYFLRVPPQMQTAKEAVAWSFGEEANDYAPLVQT